MEHFFPFTIRGASYDNRYNHSGGIYDLHKPFQKNRPDYITITHHKGQTYEYKTREKFSYYCFDAVILSDTEVEFVCYDMHDFASGGRGKEIHRFRAALDKSYLTRYINVRLLRRAMQRRDEELRLAELAICNGYANQEALELGLSFEVSE